MKLLMSGERTEWERELVCVSTFAFKCLEERMAKVKTMFSRERREEREKEIEREWGRGSENKHNNRQRKRTDT